jgi:hypothetical protein
LIEQQGKDFLAWGSKFRRAKMANLWKKRLTKMSVAIAAEVLVSTVGLDNLADYGEFILRNPNVNTVIEFIQQTMNSIG